MEDTGQAATALSVEGVSQAVKRVHLGCDAELSSDKLEDVDFRACVLPRTVKEIRIASLRVHVPDMHSFSRASTAIAGALGVRSPFFLFAELETLHLRWFDFNYRDGIFARSLSPLPSPPTFHFATLLTLSLCDTFLFRRSYPTWTQRLIPTSSPLHRLLHVEFLHSLEDLDEDDDFDRALSLFAPQLTAFSLMLGGSELGTYPDFPWTKLTTLSRLTLFPSYWQPTTLLRAALQGVPSFRSVLRVSDCRDTDNQHQMEEPWKQEALGALSKVFAKAAPSVQELNMLSVERVEEDTIEAVAEGVDKLHQAMKARGGSFKYC